MRQRIGLAQALINDPELVILDEPTSGLDPLGTIWMKESDLDLREQGKTVLMCSHRLDDVQDVCDRIAILYNGDLQELGEVQKLVEDAKRVEMRATNVQLTDSLRHDLEAVIRNMAASWNRSAIPTTTLEDLFKRVVEESKARPGRRYLPRPRDAASPCSRDAEASERSGGLANCEVAALRSEDSASRLHGEIDCDYSTLSLKSRILVQGTHGYAFPSARRDGIGGQFLRVAPERHRPTCRLVTWLQDAGGIRGGWLVSVVHLRLGQSVAGRRRQSRSALISRFTAVVGALRLHRLLVAFGMTFSASSTKIDGSRKSMASIKRRPIRTSRRRSAHGAIDRTQDKLLAVGGLLALLALCEPLFSTYFGSGADASTRWPS